MQVIDAVIDAGATTINLPDTVGYSTPDEIDEFFRFVTTRRPVAGVAYSTHCHDDLGLAVGNSLTALCAGARQVECTVNGIGERAGNASLEEVVMAMAVRPDRLPFDNAIDTRQLYPSAACSPLTGEAGSRPKRSRTNAFAQRPASRDCMLITAHIRSLPREVGVPARAGARQALRRHRCPPASSSGSRSASREVDAYTWRWSRAPIASRRS